MAIIYKLTREDGLEYIGVTVNLVKRLNKHKHSRRFEVFTIEKGKQYGVVPDTIREIVRKDIK